MRNLIILFVLSISVLIVNAQDCDGYYPLNAGTSFEITGYNKKGKVESVMNHKVESSKDISNGVEASIKMSITDGKKEQSTDIGYLIRCQNSMYYIDMKNMFSSLTSQYQGMDIEFEDGIATIPANIKVGDKLDNITMKMNMSTGGNMVMSMTIKMTDRAVTGKETKTTPAGTFECLIIEQKTSMQMGNMMTINSSSKEWLAKGVGNVRTENYDKNGNLEGYSLLTKFSK